MTPFGFTPGNSDDSNEPVDFAAMMQQMQQQIQEQFSKLGINASGFGGSNEALPKNLVRDTAKKFATAQGSAPLAQMMSPMWSKHFQLQSYGLTMQPIFRNHQIPEMLR
jgi:hypothetical protein